MSDPTGFLNGFAQALSIMALYPEGHPSRERAIDAAYQQLEALSKASALPSFTFFDDEVVYGREPLRDLKDWSWGARLVEAGIQRLEFERTVSRDQFESFLDEILARLTLSAINTSDNRQMRPLGVRFGAVGIQGQSDGPEPAQTPRLATLDLTLGDEAETMRWLQREVRSSGDGARRTPRLLARRGPRLRRRRAPPRHREGAHPDRRPDETGQADRIRACVDQPSSGRWRAHRPAERRRARPRRRRRLRTSHHPERRRIPVPPLRTRLRAGEPPRPRLRRVRCAPDQTPVPRRVGV